MKSHSILKNNAAGITREDLRDLKNELMQEFKELYELKVPQQKMWLRSAEVRKLLGVSTGTLQNMRANGTLRATKVGGIVYFNFRDIDRLMNSKD